MVQGILFVAALGAFALVIFWAVTNDAPGNSGGNTGLLAIKSEKDKFSRDRTQSRR